MMHCHGCTKYIEGEFKLFGLLSHLFYNDFGLSGREFRKGLLMYDTYFLVLFFI